jgi:adenylate cyclase
MGLAAWCHSQRFSRLMKGDLEFHRGRALELSMTALSLDSDDPRILSGAGTALMLAGTYQDLDHCLHLFQKAVAMDPNSGEAWRRLGLVQVNRSEPEEAIKAFERSLRLSQIDPMSVYGRWGIGTAHFVAGRLTEAVAFFRESLAERPRDPAFRRRLCATLALLGEVKEARTLARGLMAEYPDVGVDRMAAVAQMQPAPLKIYVEGLKKAGFS